MKNLQNNFTTPEQSTRLLELGVPADSADCYLQNESQDPLAYVNYTAHIIHPFHTKRIMFSQPEDYLPCWSVGRLMAIYFISKGLDLWYPPFKKYQIENSVEYLIALIGENIKDLDFSKLDD